MKNINNLITSCRYSVTRLKNELNELQNTLKQYEVSDKDLEKECNCSCKNYSERDLEIAFNAGRNSKLCSFEEWLVFNKKD